MAVLGAVFVDKRRNYVEAVLEAIDKLLGANAALVGE